MSRQRTQPFRIVSIALYVGIFLTKFIRETYGVCDKPVAYDNPLLFNGLIFGLIGLEVWEWRRYGSQPPRNVAIASLVTRIVAFEIIRLGDCSYFYGFVYLIVPLLAYRYFGRTFGYAMGILYSVYYAYLNFTLSGIGNGIDELLVFVVGLIFGFATANLADQEAVSRQHAERLLADLEKSNAQIAEFAATEERNRLARTIHDSLGHYLTVVGIQIDKAVAFIDIDRAEADQALIDAKWAATSALEDVRESVSTLRDKDHFSLESELTQLVRANTQIPIHLELSGDETRYSRPVLRTLYRMAQEGLTNVHKHAKASRVNLSVAFEQNAAKLKLVDDGVGFDSAEINKKSTSKDAHFGIQGLKERLDLIGGKLEIDSRPDHGTRLQITIPHEELATQ